tara:strand:+ start:169 stop:1818 length:1650 start_codon:yes stop_codon:yes gene_type:complete
MPEIEAALTYFGSEAALRASDPNIVAVAQNITQRADFLRNPRYNKWVSKATTMSYTAFILGNVSSAVVNVSTLPLFAYPILGGRFGYPTASTEMAKAMKVANKAFAIKSLGGSTDWGTGTEYERLYNTLQAHGQLEHTMAREILEGSRQRSEDFTGSKAKVMDALSYTFSATERYNRAVTGISAYKLAKNSGMSETKAIDFALDTVKEVNTSGTAATGAPIMQSDVGRLYFTFKSFNLNSAYVIISQLYDALRNAPPDVRRVAIRQAVGTLAISTSLLGVAGVPFIGFVTTIMSLINSMFGDDDEYYDPREEMYLFFGEIGYKGPLNYYTGKEVGSRIALANDILWRDDPRGLAEDGLVITAMKSAFGPAGSFYTSIERGMQEVRKGNVYRGAEYMSPSFIKNAMRGLRFWKDGGVMTLKGDDVTTDLTASDNLFKMLGFSSTEESMTYMQRGFIAGRDTYINARKTELLEAIFVATKAGDTKLVAQFTVALQKLGRRYPGLVNDNTISRSVKARERGMEDSVSGLSVTRAGKTEAQRLYDLRNLGGGD